MICQIFYPDKWETAPAEESLAPAAVKECEISDALMYNRFPEYFPFR